MSRTLIDYVSFSGTPQLLERCKEMAKHRFALSQVSEFQSQASSAVIHRERTQINYFAENLAQVLGCIEENNYANRDLYFDALANELCNAEMEIATDKSFQQCYEELIVNLGVDMLDTLCHGEIESFLELLNDEISYPGNLWTLERRGGYSGYSHSANLMCNGTQAGKVAWGAKNFGFYVSFSGKGCEAVNMVQLQKALKQMPAAKLTRVDIALDDLQGSVTIDEIMERYQDGAFITRGTPPGWGLFMGGTAVTSDDRRKCGLVPDRGRTFYVGARENGKVFRAYHKGAQMRSTEYPDWNRFEVQLGNRFRVIPFDVLTDPDPYFAGAYPALSELISEVEPIRIPTVKLVFNISLENAIKHAKTQYGKLINALQLIYDKPEEVLAVLTKGLTTADIPDRINYPVGRGIHTKQQSGELTYG
ncbi:replication initiation factor domain-containing protein [Vibrio cidicii]|uniref:replication initiation factor domain-containing protein n=1 Tax=Vibrio cidicii TaxID=1763883 RepID=UPI0018C22ED4|nr:replication initiation factor domain-containing protein [Vibrio cidicii]MBG0757605.1 replication protein [Vibrio cidicii]